MKKRVAMRFLVEMPEKRASVSINRIYTLCQLLVADQGIGYYLAQSLLEAGNKVAVMDIRTEHIERLKGTYPDMLMVLHGDATNEVSETRN